MSRKQNLRERWQLANVKAIKWWGLRLATLAIIHEDCSTKQKHIKQSAL
jgi:hypothetical protein